LDVFFTFGEIGCLKTLEFLDFEGLDVTPPLIGVTIEKLRG
jgi:hypothetical protein